MTLKVDAKLYWCGLFESLETSQQKSIKNKILHNKLILHNKYILHVINCSHTHTTDYKKYLNNA